MSRKISAMHDLFGMDPLHKCKDCKYLCSYEANRKWYKCQVYGVTNSEATDWRLSYMACGLYPDKQYDGKPIIEMLKHQQRMKPESQIDGQMEFKFGKEI